MFLYFLFSMRPEPQFSMKIPFGMNATRLILGTLVLLLGLTCRAQPLHQRLAESYDRYRSPAIETLRFKQADILPLLEALEPPFERSLLGRSVEGRPLQLIRWGEGPERVLLWSQMHGDEPTATMALMDIFNFLQASGDEFDALRQEIRQKVSLYFIPMLNPDGAERFQRRNALGIDLNRDALRLQSPEARVLKTVRDELEPTWGFNLHDQSRYYAAGKTGRQAGISFLAPAYNEEKEVNAVRDRAMRLIGILQEALQAYIPNQLARYDDEFEPRAFGDNIQKWGTSTILIESGGLLNDPEKQRLRKLHFVALLTAFEAIADGRYAQTPLAAYESLPMNDYGAYHDLILRQVVIAHHGSDYLADLAFRRIPVDYNDARDYFYRGTITDLGDLSTQHAYEEVEANDYRLVLGKVYEQPLKDSDAVKDLDMVGLVTRGYTDVLIDEWPRDNRFHQLPVRLLSTYDPAAREIRLGGNPSLLLEKDGEYHFAVVNGTLFDLRGDQAALRRQWGELVRK